MIAISSLNNRYVEELHLNKSSIYSEIEPSLKAMVEILGAL